MKVKSLLLMAFVASMTFVACDNDENVNGTSPANMPKSVTISLSNVMPVTRGTGLPVKNGTQVALADLQVFFTDGNTLYKGKNATGSDATHYFSSLTEFNAAERDQVFHFLSASVNKVIVVGNLGSESNAATYAELQKELTIADQQETNGLYLYAEEGLTLAADTHEDDFGHPLYEASVTLEPRVSRIEVASFTYNADPEGNRKYTSIEIDQIMLNNFYTKVEDSRDGVASEIQRKTIDAGTVFGLFESTTGWYSDKFDDTDPAKLDVVTLNEGSAFTHVYADDAKRPAYHFFPNATDISSTSHPQLVVKLIGTLPDGTQEPLYLATEKFNPAVSTNFAKIYTMDFEFNDKNFQNPEKCVTVTVNVTSWDVQEVTPEFPNN